MSIIYIAGPYTKGDVALNVAKAIEVGMHYNDKGDYAVIPHLTHFTHMMHPRPYKYWITLDNLIIPKCDKLVRIAGDSPGADDEVKLAEASGLEIIKWPH